MLISITILAHIFHFGKLVELGEIHIFLRPEFL